MYFEELFTKNNTVDDTVLLAVMIKSTNAFIYLLGFPPVVSNSEQSPSAAVSNVVQGQTRSGKARPAQP